MILVDFNQVCISNLMAQIGNHTELAVQEDLVRHMILNSLRLYKQKFGVVYGQMVIACDDKNYWRKSLFPYYKAGRKKVREESSIDWSSLFEILNKVRQEVKDNLPYMVLQVDNVEADDIIATVCRNTTDDVLILSADKDFIQLHNDKVIQFDPIRKKNIKVDRPDLYLKELVIRGDSGDGVPNAMSPDNALVDGIRQKKIMKSKVEEWVKLSWDQILKVEELQTGIVRNKKLIDLSEIPEPIVDKILDHYYSQLNEMPKKINIINYFQQHKLSSLMENVNDFL
jgi:5'-3' exonuclease